MATNGDIVVACPKCTQKYRVPETGIGRRAFCKKCGQPFRVAVDAPIDEVRHDLLVLAPQALIRRHQVGLVTVLERSDRASDPGESRSRGGR